MTQRQTRQVRFKWLYFGLGWGFFGLGLLGAFLPLLPTTVFMILALWAFARSSPRFHDWLYTHPVFGPPLQRWHRHGVIPSSAKIAAVAVMAASMGWIVWRQTLPVWAIGLTAVVMAGVAVFIVTRPGRAPEASDR